MTKKKRPNKKPLKKTPYQGPNRVRGFFKCDYGHYWESKNSWANCGMKCKTCLESMDKDKSGLRLIITYTYPFSQEPLSKWVLYCEICDRTVKHFYKSKPCPCGKGRLLPMHECKCDCGYFHEWPMEPKQAKNFEFICRDEAEPGWGCDRLLKPSPRKTELEKKVTPPHPQNLCEKCVSLGRSCRKKEENKNLPKKRKTTPAKKPSATLNGLKSTKTTPEISNDAELKEETTPAKKSKRKKKKKKSPSVVVTKKEMAKDPALISGEASSGVAEKLIKPTKAPKTVGSITAALRNLGLS